MVTSRERFLRTLAFKQADPPWARWGSYIWHETATVWRTQGYPGPESGESQWLTEQTALDTFVKVDPWYGPVPEFEFQVIEEDERIRLYVNHEGILMREFKAHSDASMPQFVKFPVQDADEFERLAEKRLALNAEQRFPREWKQHISNAHAGNPAGTQEEHPRFCWADRWGGFFGPLRNLVGIEGLCLAFYDRPELVERMMEERADRIIEITTHVLEHTHIDMFGYWEDMAYNHGSLVDPKLFRKFALKHYRRVNDWLHRQGIEHIFLDSDGNVTSLIPIWLESGINVLWPLERQSGMDPVELRKAFGRDLVLFGGIDKRTLVPGGDTMRREVDRVMPLVEDGGYIPELDHGVPPDIPWANFCEYIAYLKSRLRRG